jgi:VIT1/CCC1 family predicted Fe2+/Mn2+ transporter
MANNSSFKLEEHLEKEHKITPITIYLKEIVYGGIDGIITTFAIVAGFAGAQANPMSKLPILTVLLFGFANLFADGISMALGNFISSRSEKDVYKNAKEKERYEITHHPEMERAESVEILLRKGFKRQQAEDLLAIYMTNPAYWTDFMMNQELELPNPEGDNPLLTSLATLFSFITFGFIPLMPYAFFGDKASFLTSISATFIALSLLGVIRWRVGQRSALRSIGEVLLLGSVAAITAYFVGTLFKI